MLEKPTTILLSIAISMIGLAEALRGQSPSIGSSYSVHEAERQARIARQIAVQDQVRWLAGLPPRHDGPAFPSLDYIYSGAAWGPSVWPTPYIFEPWPFVPGDIFGAPNIFSVAQPKGFKITPTGPNGYIYQPVYSKPPTVAAPQPATAPQPVAAPSATKSSQPRATAPEELPPPRPSVLREF